MSFEGEIVGQTETKNENIRGNKKTLIIVAISFLTLSLCSCACLVIFFGQSNRVSNRQEAVLGVLDDFMGHLVDRDIQNAFYLFSTRAQDQVDISEIEVMIEGVNYVLVDGYQELYIEALTASRVINTNPDIPQGNLVQVNGSVIYENGMIGSFDASLEEGKDDGIWYLYWINITVPVEKYELYKENSQ